MAKQNARFGANQPTALNRAMKVVRPALWTAVVFSFFINILGLTAPLYMMQVYDRVLSSRSITTLVVLTILIAILYFTSSLLESLRSQLLVRAGVTFDGEINEEAVRSGTARDSGSAERHACPGPAGHRYGPRVLHGSWHHLAL